MYYEAMQNIVTSIWFRRTLYVLMALSVVIRLVYMLYTHRTWEDALITVLHSENAASGLGLTHLQPAGQKPLHGFTSPLSVLVPLVGDLMHIGFGVTFLKLVTAFLAPVAVWLGARICLLLNVSEPLTLALVAFLALEHHQILWGMAGMETGLVTLCYLFSIWAMLEGTQWAKGLSLGLVMLARPDAAFWVAFALAVEIYRASRSGHWRRLGPVVGGLILLYGPWIFFTTLYYGSPVPNTILAKGLGYPSIFQSYRHMSLTAFVTLVKSRSWSVLATFGPSYGGNGTGFAPLLDSIPVRFLLEFSFCAGVLAALLRRDRPALIVTAFAVMYLLYLMFAVNLIFGWYTVPVVAGCAIVAMYGMDALLGLLHRPSITVPAGAVIGAAWILSLVAVLPSTFRSDWAVQRYLDDGLRGSIGRYLGEVSYPSDTISSESLGYVGYYSRRVIYDYPGLCSRVVVGYLRQYPDPQMHHVWSMAEHLQPTYMVFRPFEASTPSGTLYPWILKNYDLVADFKASPHARDSILYYDNNIDREFLVFRHKGAPNRPIPGMPTTSEPLLNPLMPDSAR
jgi:hypothetical protein